MGERELPQPTATASDTPPRGEWGGGGMGRRVFPPFRRPAWRRWGGVGPRVGGGASAFRPIAADAAAAHIHSAAAHLVPFFAAAPGWMKGEDRCTSPAAPAGAGSLTHRPPPHPAPPVTIIAVLLVVSAMVSGLPWWFQELVQLVRVVLDDRYT